MTNEKVQNNIENIIRTIESLPGPVGRGCLIHRLHFSRGVRLLQRVSCI